MGNVFGSNGDVSTDLQILYKLVTDRNDEKPPANKLGDGTTKPTDQKTKTPLIVMKSRTRIRNRKQGESKALKGGVFLFASTPFSSRMNAEFNSSKTQKLEIP